MYRCKICELVNMTPQHYKTHCKTKKHMNNVKQKRNIPIDYTEEYIFACVNCFKKYKSNKGLWQHKKKCIDNNNNISSQISPPPSSINSITPPPPIIALQGNNNTL